MLKYTFFKLIVVADASIVCVRCDVPSKFEFDKILSLCFLSKFIGWTTRTVGVVVYPAPPFRFTTDKTRPLPVSI